MSMMDDQLDAQVNDSRDAEHDAGRHVLDAPPGPASDAGQEVPRPDPRSDDELIADLREDVRKISGTVLGGGEGDPADEVPSEQPPSAPEA